LDESSSMASVGGPGCSQSNSSHSPARGAPPPPVPAGQRLGSRLHAEDVLTLTGLEVGSNSHCADICCQSLPTLHRHEPPLIGRRGAAFCSTSPTFLITMRKTSRGREGDGIIAGHLNFGMGRTWDISFTLRLLLPETSHALCSKPTGRWADPKVVPKRKPRTPSVPQLLY
jgi:hypothetical protein